MAFTVVIVDAISRAPIATLVSYSSNFFFTQSANSTYCFVLRGLIRAAHRNGAEPDSNEEYKFSQPNLNKARRTYNLK